MGVGVVIRESYGPGTNFAAARSGDEADNVGLRQIGELAILLASAGTTMKSSLRQMRHSFPVPQHLSHRSETPIAAS